MLVRQVRSDFVVRMLAVASIVLECVELELQSARIRHNRRAVVVRIYPSKNAPRELKREAA